MISEKRFEDKINLKYLINLGVYDFSSSGMNLKVSCSVWRKG